MARTPEPDVKITEALQPQARVYDTYVKPEAAQPSPLHEVAAALGPLSSDLFALGAQQQGVANKQDAAQAETDFWNNNQEGASHAVANNLIPSFKSPAYMDAYGRIAGMNDALRLKQSIGPDYQTLDKTAQGDDAFDKWFLPKARDHANPALKNNPGYAHSYGVGITQLHSELSTQYTRDRSEAVKAGVTTEFGAAIGNTINEQYPTGTSDLDTIKLADSLNAIRDFGYKRGMEKAAVDKMIVDVVTTKAIERKNPALLEVLNNIGQDPADPSGAKLGEAEYGNAKILATRSHIQTVIHQDTERQRTEQLHKDTQAANAAIGDVMTQWSKDINYQPTDAQLQAIKKTKPEFESTMATLRGNILNNNTVEDPQAQAKLYEDIGKNNGGMDRVLFGIRTGVLKTRESIKAAADYANLVENYNRVGGAFKVTEDPAFKSIEQAIITHTKDPKFFGSMFAEQGVTDAGRQALNDSRRVAMEWQLAHPNASPLERQKFLFDLQEGILKNITRPAEALGIGDTGFQPKYTPIQGQPAPAAAPRAAPAAAPAQPQPAAPAGAPAAPAGGPAGQAPGKQGGTTIDTPEKALAAIQAMPAAPRFEDLPNLGVAPQVIKQITDGAAARGMTPQQLLDTIHQKVAPAPGKQGAAEPQPGAQPVSFELPGGGRMDLHGVSPEVMTQLNHMAQQAARLAHGGDAAALASTGNTKVASLDPSAGIDHKQGADTMTRGDLSAKFESARQGSASVSRDRTGGWSYGRYQFAAGGTVADGSAIKAFIGELKTKAPELAASLEQAGGQAAAKAGSPEFKAAWNAAAKDPRFREAEDANAWKELVGPATNLTKQRTGLDVNTRSHAVQEVMWSAAVQHGGNGAAHLWQAALKGQDPNKMTDAQLIDALYAERSKVGIYFKSSTPQVQASVRNRFAEERRDAQAMLAKEPKPASSQTAQL